MRRRCRRSPAPRPQALPARPIRDSPDLDRVAGDERDEGGREVADVQEVPDLGAARHLGRTALEQGAHDRGNEPRRMLARTEDEEDPPPRPRAGRCPGGVAGGRPSRGRTASPVRSPTSSRRRRRRSSSRTRRRCRRRRIAHRPPRRTRRRARRSPRASDRSPATPRRRRASPPTRGAAGASAATPRTMAAAESLRQQVTVVPRDARYVDTAATRRRVRVEPGRHEQRQGVPADEARPAGDEDAAHPAMRRQAAIAVRDDRVWKRPARRRWRDRRSGRPGRRPARTARRWHRRRPSRRRASGTRVRTPPGRRAALPFVPVSSRPNQRR